MTRHEERVFRSAKPKTDLATLRNQLQRLKGDLEQYLARNRSSPMIAPLKERIRELEGTIAAAEERSARPRSSGWTGSIDGAAAQRAEAPPRSHGGPAGGDRFPPRRRAATGPAGDGDSDE
ncbi:hypothetical protein [Azospirillum sp. B4]|uniref:hypothetical protein n=1 Tax=Azospirillum sp. B4 TaxID=95605 RepID=UPI00034DB59D|nr:hypothetical protein [Azospirillum sp. B4]